MPGHTTAGKRLRHRREDVVGLKELVYRRRVSVEIEQPTSARDSDAEVAKVRKP
jgi:hypothetical protein